MAVKKIDFSTMKKLQKMSKNDFSRWLNVFGKEMWEQGFADATNDTEPGMTETDQTIRCVFDEDSLFDVLISVRGVSKRIANDIMDAMLHYYGEPDSIYIEDGSEASQEVQI